MIEASVNASIIEEIAIPSIVRPISQSHHAEMAQALAGGSRSQGSAALPFGECLHRQRSRRWIPIEVGAH